MQAFSPEPNEVLMPLEPKNSMSPRKYRSLKGIRKVCGTHFLIHNLNTE
jgi:hypothetical protein